MLSLEKRLKQLDPLLNNSAGIVKHVASSKHDNSLWVTSSFYFDPFWFTEQLTVLTMAPLESYLKPNTLNLQSIHFSSTGCVRYKRTADEDRLRKRGARSAQDWEARGRHSKGQQSSRRRVLCRVQIPWKNASLAEREEKCESLNVRELGTAINESDQERIKWNETTHKSINWSIRIQPLDEIMPEGYNWSIQFWTTLWT